MGLADGEVVLCESRDERDKLGGSSGDGPEATRKGETGGVGDREAGRGEARVGPPPARDTAKASLLSSIKLTGQLSYSRVCCRTLR